MTEIRKLKSLNKTTCKKRLRLPLNILMVIIPIICLYFTVVLTFENLDSIKKDISYNVNRMQHSKTENIEYILHNRINQGKMQNEFISSAIKLHLTDENKRLLADSINRNETDIISQDLTRILSRITIYDMKITKMFNINLTDHILFISNKYGILDIKDIGTLYPHTELIPWSEIVNNKINKTLAQNAIFELLSNRHNLIFWESDVATQNRFIIGVSNPNKYSLESIIHSTPTGELINYNILVPIYVSLNDSPDDYDFIIVREINIFYAIKPFIYDINRYDFLIDEYKYNMNALLFLTAFIGTLISLLLLGCILVGVMSSNIYIRHTKHRTGGDIHAAE